VIHNQQSKLTPTCCQVVRIGRGGAANPFMYRLGDALLPPPSLAPSSTCADGDDGCASSPAHLAALGPAAIFEEMAALMAPRFRGAAPCGASFGGGADDSVGDDVSVGEGQDVFDGLDPAPPPGGGRWTRTRS
jgi:hypothetical protein